MIVKKWSPESFGLVPDETKWGNLKQFRDYQRSPKTSEQIDNNFEGSSKLTK